MDNRKIVIASFVASSFIVGFLSHHSIQFALKNFSQLRRIPNSALVAEFLPVGLAALTFLILFRHTQTNQVLDEVITELKKVTWPNRQDVTRSTIVVIVFIMIAGAFIAGFDVIWGKFFGYLLS